MILVMGKHGTELRNLTMYYGWLTHGVEGQIAQYFKIHKGKAGVNW